ncbi:hypothetical protein VC83_08230 [Pseudogymnoascus destructans]|uniref:CENP-V/GFA domain-containing protein n=1 Tax=Pseudogymnoascus destructans TaxID=655981 RepID=A0A177A108_9PEZI|nr:uncharacterized protein VC83_08230 [Pseudogymnoascus destructans]OAF55270.1 hypothetical protein VC83_08230 [Pseudogymnoascus destructans]
MSTPPPPSPPPQTHSGTCHCSHIRSSITSTLPSIVSCDCSICVRREALIQRVPDADFHPISPTAASLEDRTHGLIECRSQILIHAYDFYHGHFSAFNISTHTVLNRCNALKRISASTLPDTLQWNALALTEASARCGLDLHRVQRYSDADTDALLDDLYTLEQLKDPRMNIRIVRPLVDPLYDPPKSNLLSPSKSLQCIAPHQTVSPNPQPK